MKKKQAMADQPFEGLGIVVPAEWDIDGLPSAWAISTYDEKLYKIQAHRSKGHDLSLLPGRKIRVYGKLIETEEGNHDISIERYVVLEDDA